MKKRKKIKKIYLKDRISQSKDGINKLSKKGSGFFGEFKEFALRGNVIDLAVGVIIGGAFQKIVSSFVSDLAMPLISRITGKVNYNDMYVPILIPENVSWEKGMSIADAQNANIITLNYGAFITTFIDFMIMAFVIFLFVKFLNKLTKINKKNEPKPEVTEKDCPYCLSKIPVKAVRCKFCTSELK